MNRNRRAIWLAGFFVAIRSESMRKSKWIAKQRGDVPAIPTNGKDFLKIIVLNACIALSRI
jgi:hypothetical protein